MAETASDQIEARLQLRRGVMWSQFLSAAVILGERNIESLGAKADKAELGRGVTDHTQEGRFMRRAREMRIPGMTGDAMARYAQLAIELSTAAQREFPDADALKAATMDFATDSPAS